MNKVAEDMRLLSGQSDRNYRGTKWEGVCECGEEFGEAADELDRLQAELDEAKAGELVRYGKGSIRYPNGAVLNVETHQIRLKWMPDQGGEFTGEVFDTIAAADAAGEES